MDPKNTLIKTVAEIKEEAPLPQNSKNREKAALKLNIKKTKIVASGPITSWQIDGETVESDRL